MRLVILDRDGVVNEDSGEHIKSEQEWHAIPGSLSAIAKLNHHGYRVVVATNQSGLASGKFTLKDLNRIHQKMHTHLAQFGGVVEAIFFCPHGPDAGCDCRKPKPGLFHDIQKRLHISLKDVVTVGDKCSDMEAALAVGCKPMLVKTGQGQSQIDAGRIADTIPVYADLAAAASAILSGD